MRRFSVSKVRSVGSFLLTLLVLATVAPNSAVADEATEKYLQAVEDYEAGKLVVALEGFREAFSASESPNAQLYIARCLKALGRNAEAFREMSATVALAREKAVSEKRYAKTRDAAAAELAVLEPKVSKIIVVLSEEVPNAEITVNEAPLLGPDWGKPFAIEPGALTVEATAPGYAPIEKIVSVDAGETETVALTLEPAVVSDEDDEDGGGIVIGPLRGAGIGVAALGLGGIVAFAVTGSMARNKFDEVSDACGGMTCTDDSQNDTIDEGKSLQTGANVALGLGLGLIAGGVVMIIFGGSDEPERAGDVSWSVEPTIGGGYGQLELTF